MPHEYEDNEDREPPYNAAVASEQGISGAGGYSVPVAADYTLRGYKSTAVMLNGHGGAVTVEVGWRHSEDVAGSVMLETKTQPSADASTLLFVNQGDILDHVTITGGGNIDYAVVESNQLPLPPSVTGAVYPSHQNISLPGWFEFGFGGPGASSLVVDALSFHNYVLRLDNQNHYMSFYFLAGPRYARHEIVFTGSRGPNFGIQRYLIASILPDVQADQGYNVSTSLMQNPHVGVPAPVFVDIGASVDRYNAALVRNVTWGINFRVDGAQDAALSAFGLDSDFFTSGDGGPGLYMMKVLMDTKNGASAGYRAEWSEIGVHRIGDSGYM